MTQKTARSDSKEPSDDWLDCFIRNQAPITGKDLCQLRHHTEIQALRDSGEANGRAAEMKYWDERLEESERRLFNEEAAAMKTFVPIFQFSLFLIVTSNGFNIVHNIYTALNKIVTAGCVAGGLEIYVKTAFRDGPKLEVSSFHCGDHGDNVGMTFEQFAANESAELHDKWKEYMALALAGNVIDILCVSLIVT
jgi:hypothetical protein